MRKGLLTLGNTTIALSGIMAVLKPQPGHNVLSVFVGSAMLRMDHSTDTPQGALLDYNRLMQAWESFLNPKLTEKELESFKELQELNREISKALRDGAAL